MLHMLPLEDMSNVRALNATCRNGENSACICVAATTATALYLTTRLLRLLSSTTRATSSFHLHLSLPRGFVRRVYLCPLQSDQKGPVRRSGWVGRKRAERSLPWSHWLTLSSLHAVIGSMLGVLLQSLLQFPAVLADFYLSGLVEEEKIDADLGSGDDESFFHPQVQVRVSLLSANGAEMSGSAGSKDPSLTLSPTTSPNPSPAGVVLVGLNNFLHNSVRNEFRGGTRRQAQHVEAEGVGSGNT